MKKPRGEGIAAGHGHFHLDENARFKAIRFEQNLAAVATNDCAAYSPERD
jgi:hypothetical protein